MDETKTQRPILFSTEMVTAIRDGKKTQTRRICKPCKDHSPVEYDGMWMWKQGVRWGAVTNPTYPPCPYGKQGDQLYVRETWWAWGHWQHDIDTKTGKSFKFFEWTNNTYAMDFLENYPDKPDWIYPSDLLLDAWHKRPAIFLPKDHSRILLEIVSVRVELLNAITEDDAIAEGCRGFRMDTGLPDGSAEDWIEPIEHYAWLWNCINIGKPGHDWKSNPWVWVVEFKVIPGDAQSKRLGLIDEAPATATGN